MQGIKDIIKGTVLLTNTIIGVGFFALPFIALKSSFLFLILYFLFLGSIVFFIHLFYAKVCLATPDYKRLPGFVGYYLGKKWEFFALLVILFSLFGTLLSYLIVGGSFLKEIFSFTNSLLPTTLFFFIGSFLIFKDIKLIFRFQFFSFLFLFFLLFLLYLFQAKSLTRYEILFSKPDLHYWFLPYGVVIFSLWGTSIIPELEEQLNEEREKKLKTIIYLSFFFSIIFYLLFCYLVLVVVGNNIGENALSGLKDFFSPFLQKMIFSLGLATVLTSFVSLGLTLRRVLSFDLGVKNEIFFVFVFFLVYLFYLLGFQRFLSVISFVGTVFLALEGIFILSLYQRVKKSKISLFLSIFLILGIVYEIFIFLKNRL